MELFARIRSFVLRRVILTTLGKRVEKEFQTSGDEARKNDFYVAYLLDDEGEARFVVEHLSGNQVHGKWSPDGQDFTEARSIEIADLAKFRLWIHHYYRGWTFYTVGIEKFLFNKLTCWPWIRVTYDRYLQSRFNKQELPRHARIRVLRFILAETVKDRTFQARPTGLLTAFYTVRWVHRHDKDELITYYTLLLDSMVDSHDLSKTQGSGYELKPQALNTITSFNLEEQRHLDDQNTQNRIYWLTAVLIAVGVVQAGAAAYDAWWKPPETFTGTIEGRSIFLSRE